MFRDESGQVRICGRPRVIYTRSMKSDRLLLSGFILSCQNDHKNIYRNERDGFRRVDVDQTLHNTRKEWVVVRPLERRPVIGYSRERTQLFSSSHVPKYDRLRTFRVFILFVRMENLALTCANLWLQVKRNFSQGENCTACTDACLKARCWVQLGPPSNTTPKGANVTK